MYHPDITTLVDWVQNTNWLTYLSSIEFCYLGLLFIQGKEGGGGGYTRITLSTCMFLGFVQKISSEPPNLL